MLISFLLLTILDLPLFAVLLGKWNGKFDKAAPVWPGSGYYILYKVIRQRVGRSRSE